MKKRILSMALALLMVMGMLPTMAFAASSYTDVPDTWYTDAVDYVTDNGLMVGIGNNQFGPEVSVSRGMVVTVLHRMENTPDAVDSDFSDVPDGEWYSEAVDWAAANDIVEGYNGLYRPLDSITRQELAAIFYRYAEYKGYDVTARADLSGYTDEDTISSWAVEPMQWAVAVGLITSNSTTSLTMAPTATATRAQLAVMLQRMIEKILPGLTTEAEVFTVTFLYNYGSAGTYTTVEVKDGEKVSKPTNPTRSGYTFNGWYTKASGGSAYDFNAAVTADLTLYAHWSYNGGGGVIIHTHTYSNEWSSDASGHWYAATCGHDLKKNEAAHVYGDDFSCTAADTCEVCGYEKAAGEHSYVRTLNDDETTGTFTCSGCGDSYTESYVAKVSDGTDTTYHTTLSDASSAAAGKNLTLLEDNYILSVEEIRAAVSSEAAVVDFNGATTAETIYDAYVAAGTIKNLTSIDMKNWYVRRANVTFENCTFKEGTQYAFHVDSTDQQNPDLTSATITFTDCEFSGIIALGEAITNITFDGCTFKTGGNGYDYINSRQDMIFDGCTFVDSFGIDDESATKQTWTFTNCTGVEKVSLNGTGTYQTVSIVWDGSDVSVGELRSLVSSRAAVVDFNGATTTETIYDAYVAAGTIENLNSIDMKNWYIRSENVTFEDCSFTEGDQYAFHVDSIDTNITGLTSATITFDGCTFSGFTALGEAITSITFDGCTFASGGNGYDYINSRQNMTFTGCSFANGFGIDDESNEQQTLTFTDCISIPTMLNGSGTCKTVIIDGAISSDRDVTFTGCTFADGFSIDDMSSNVQTWSFEDCTNAPASLNGSGTYETVNIEWSNNGTLSSTDLHNLMRGRVAVVDFNGANSVADVTHVYVRAAEIQNLNTTGTRMWHACTDGITFKGCTFNETEDNYAVHFDSVYDAANQLTSATVTFDTCTLNGFSAIGSTIITVFNNCTFGDGNYTEYINSYQNMTFTGCTFSCAYLIDDESEAQQTLTFTDCTNLNNVTIGGSKNTITVIGK